MKEESFAFIEENIMESKKTKRRFAAEVKRIILYGLIFGTIAGSTFAVVNTFVSQWFDGDGETENIALSTTVAPRESDSPKKTKKPNENEAKTEEQKLIAMQNMYSLIAKQAKKVNWSLVEISAAQEREEGNNPLITDSVSGAVVAKTKKSIMILTRYSSISNIQEIKVDFMDHSTAGGSLYNYDSRVNLAIVKVSMSEITTTALKNIEVIEFGDSQFLEQGELVYVVGQPDGVINSIDFGYITRESSVQNMEDYQLDMYGTSMNYHSGGYGIVCDMNGQCLGILDSKFKKEDTTDFMGISKLRFILENLLNQKKQVYVGIMGRGITEEYLEQFNYQTGLYITEVAVGSPAYEAGIQAGDVIRTINEKKIGSMVEFFEAIQKYKPKEILEFTIIRENSKGKKEMSVDVKLQERN